MPHKPIINIPELKKTGIFDKDRFFRLLSEQNNYMDPKAAEDFYMGLVRLITSELKINGVVGLPGLGHIALVKITKRPILFNGKFQRVKGKHCIRLFPLLAWRQVFTKIEEQMGENSRLDPREKMLGQILD